MLLRLQAVELELRKLEETVESIHEEMLYLREKYAFGYLNLQVVSSLKLLTPISLPWFAERPK